MAWVAATIAGLLFLIASVRFGGRVSGDELDPAWGMVLSWASSHGLHWGRDIVFTYGPLGYLYPLNAGEPERYGAYVAIQIALAAAAAFLFANGWFVQRWPERIVLLAAIVFNAPLLAADPVWLAMPVFAIVGMHAHAVAGRSRALWLLLVVAAAYASTLLLIKMSTVLLIGAWWLAGVIVLLGARRGAHAVAWLLLVPLCSLGLWIWSGQRVGDLLPFVDGVLEMSRGYTAAMGIPPPLRFDLYGLAVLGGIGILGLWTVWQARRDAARFACIVLCGLALFVAWRAGFTRADSHVAIFALTVLLVLPLLPAMAPVPTGWLRVASLGLALAAAPIADRTYNAGVDHRPGDLAMASPGFMANNAVLLTRPLTYAPALYTAWADERTRLDLPRTRAVVGRRSIDLLGTQQGVVVVNDFNYRPAPVFQGYAAYTPHLQQLNAAAYRGPERTDFVLLAYSPIDGNLPTSENALAFTTLYAGYRPVLVEKSYLLLENDADAALPQPPVEPNWQDATWDQWIDMPQSADAVSILAVRSELSLAGRVMATLLREPLQFIELELVDGTTRRFRLGRGVAPGGVLVSPLVQSLDDYARLFIGADLPAVRRFRMQPQSDALRPMFADGIQWSVTSLPRRPRVEPPSTMFDALFPGFSHWPQAWPHDAHTLDVEGRRALFMHSPARLAFRPGAGRYIVSGEIGIVPNAFTTAECSAGDGVEIEVSGAPGTTLAYPFDPFGDASLRPTRRFELWPVDSTRDGELFLDVSPGPVGNGDCDWAYLRDVRIRSIESAEGASRSAR